MSNLLMSSSVAFVGVGQAGGNIAFEFHKLGYTTYYINTSSVDLSTIDVPKKYKYQIPLAQGCSKDRNLAKEYTKDHFGTIVNIIDSRMSNFTHIFFCFSMGGGTGSGITPLLINSLATGMKDITFGVIAALPKISESPKAKHNATTCYRELEEIDGLGNIYFIDNNKSDLFTESQNKQQQLDRHFASRLNDMLSITKANIKGNADESEIHTLLSIYGNVAIANISSEYVEDNFGVPRVELDKSIATIKKGCSHLAYSIVKEDDFAQHEAEDMFGKPEDFFKGYNNSKSFVVAFGLPFPDEAIKRLTKEYKSDIEVISSIDVQTTEIDIGEFIDIAAMRRKKNIKTGSLIGKIMLEDLN